MNEAARFLLSLGAAVCVHVAVLPGLPGGGGGGGAGEGGENSVSVVASNGAVEAMVARWQAAPGVSAPSDVTPEPAEAPALPVAPTRTAHRALTLPQGAPRETIESDAPVPPAPPPERVFAALPVIATPEAGPEPAALADLPVLPDSALAQSLSMPTNPARLPDPAAPPPAAQPLPARDVAALAPIPVPPPAARSGSEDRAVPDDPVVSAVAPLAPLPAAPEASAPVDTLPVIAPPPPPLTRADPTHPAIDRTPVPPRRPERVAAQAEPPARQQPQQQARPVVQSRTQAAPALTARGQGGGAQAGAGGGSAAAGDPAAQRSAMARWGAQIRSRVERRTQRQRGRGSVALVLRVNTSGALDSVSVRQGSGDPALDQAALAAARGAGPFPAAPDVLGRGSHAFAITLAFRR